MLLIGQEPAAPGLRAPGPSSSPSTPDEGVSSHGTSGAGPLNEPSLTRAALRRSCLPLRSSAATPDETRRDPSETVFTLSGVGGRPGQKCDFGTSWPAPSARRQPMAGPTGVPARTGRGARCPLTSLGSQSALPVTSTQDFCLTLGARLALRKQSF